MRGFWKLMILQNPHGRTIDLPDKSHVKARARAAALVEEWRDQHPDIKAGHFMAFLAYREEMPIRNRPGDCQNSLCKDKTCPGCNMTR
jgi:hypothetical protein